MNDKLVELLNKVDKVISTNNETYESLLKKVFEDVNVDNISKTAEMEAVKLIKERFGEIPKVTKIEVGNKISEIKGHTHKKYKDILTLIANGENVLLNGPSGTGKNVLGRQIAEALGLEFYCTPAIRQEYKLSGFTDANGNFVETPFYKAWTNGGVYLFDELDASDPSVVLNINSALANGYYEFPIGLKNKHKDFHIIAAANTLGNGGDRLYTAREELDASTIDRFAVVPFDYDGALEQKLALNAEIYNFVVAVREAVQKTGLRYVVSMRATKSLSNLYGKLDTVDLVRMIVCKNMTKNDIKTLHRQVSLSANNPLYAALTFIANE